MSRIVVGVDGSEQADRALHWAVREAELRSAEIELVHAYVIHVHGYISGKTDREYAMDRLDAVIERNRALLDRVKWSEAIIGVVGSVAAGLMDAGEDAELIVVGARGIGGFNGLFVGSTGYRTAAHASTPVAVIRGDDDTRAADGRRAIVVGIDGSRASRRALRWSLEEAARRGVGLTVVHGYVAPSGTVTTLASRDQYDQYRERLHHEAVDLVDRMMGEVYAGGDVAVDQVVSAGGPAGVLLEHSGPDRLLVVGTHGRGALGRAVFGSISHQVLQHATGPVVVVP